MAGAFVLTLTTGMAILSLPGTVLGSPSEGAYCTSTVILCSTVLYARAPRYGRRTCSRRRTLPYAAKPAALDTGPRSSLHATAPSL
jgi:hypothetical protein